MLGFVVLLLFAVVRSVADTVTLPAYDPADADPVVEEVRVQICVWPAGVAFASVPSIWQVLWFLLGLLA